MRVEEPHHIAWLQAHPDRDADWLRAMLKDGFDVHHLDGNHGNNDPLNLVLIEHVDHLRCIHRSGGNRMLAVLKANKRPPEPKREERRETTQTISARRWVARKKATREQRLNGINLL